MYGTFLLFSFPWSFGGIRLKEDHWQCFGFKKIEIIEKRAHAHKQLEISNDNSVCVITLIKCLVYIYIENRLLD